MGIQQDEAWGTQVPLFEPDDPRTFAFVMSNPQREEPGEPPYRTFS